ncbi:unnamed protein product [Cunninghamella blakesleeana]
MTKFGRSLRSDFFFEENYISLNHGSYGTYPKKIQKKIHYWQNEAEKNPDRFLKREIWPILEKNKKLVADFLNCRADELVFVNNCSVGINAVLRSLILNKNDKVICFTTAYDAVEKTMVYLHDTIQMDLVKIELNYPLSDDDIVNLVKKTIEKESPSSIKLCVMDAISSVPGLRFPFERVVQLLKEYNILSLVDGAHAIGQIHLNLKESQPDFFVTNLHKWLLAPRGLSVVYVPVKNQYLIHPAVINASYNPHTKDDKDVTSNFQAEFNWPGTSDFSTYLCVEDVLEYRKSLGGEEKIIDYCSKLAREGGQLAADILGTDVLENEQKSLTACMVNVRLPLHHPHPNYSNGEIVQFFIDKLIYEHNCMAPVYFHNSHWYTRLSAQVYNDTSDFTYVANALLVICKELNQQKHLKSKI